MQISRAAYNSIYIYTCEGCLLNGIFRNMNPINSNMQLIFSFCTTNVQNNKMSACSRFGKMHLSSVRIYLSALRLLIADIVNVLFSYLGEQYYRVKAFY